MNGGEIYERYHITPEAFLNVDFTLAICTVFTRDPQKSRENQALFFGELWHLGCCCPQRLPEGHAAARHHSHP
jgi:hypothetical protein